MQTLYGQGTARFSDEEISSFKKRIWGSLDALLVASRQKTNSVDELFWVLGGDQPSEADAVLFGFIVSALVSTAYASLSDQIARDRADCFFRSPESKRIVETLSATVEYAKRIHNRYFPDYAYWE